MCYGWGTADNLPAPYRRVLSEEPLVLSEWIYPSRNTDRAHDAYVEPRPDHAAYLTAVAELDANE